MKITLITTVDHNVGDDFVREGIKFLLKKSFKTNSLRFQHIHKHSPFTTRYGFGNLKHSKIAKALDAILPQRFPGDRIREADIVVQCGAPVYWCHDVGGGHCCDNEWYLPLIETRFKESKKSRLLNIAAGTCQKYHSQGDEFCPRCNDYIKKFHDLTAVTTLRDSLASAVLEKIGISAPVIPCSSIFAVDEYNLQNNGEEYVVVNYMRGGAHYTFGQEIDFDKWEREFKSFYFDLKKRERVIFSCHNQKEVDEAKKIDPNAEVFYKKNDFLAYMNFYSKAKYGVMNRVHGAFLIAAFGKPSIVIGNDSRARMSKNIGLESFFVNDVTSDLLSEKYELLEKKAESFKEMFRTTKEKAYSDYMEALSVLH